MQPRSNESRIRRMATRHGFTVHKSRQQPHINNLGEFRLVHGDTNCVVRCEHYDATLAEIETFLREAADAVA